MTYPNPIDPRTDARAQAKAANAYAKATRPWYRMKRTWVGGFLALVVIGSLASPDAAEPTRVAPAPVAAPTPTVTAPATPSQPAAKADTKSKLGTAVKAGDMSYTVTDFTTTKKLSSVFGNKTGNWVVVSIKVDNQGKDAAYITSGDFKIIESDGTEYSTDTDAFMYLKTEENLLLEKLNPKLSQTGKLLFAVPEGITGKGMTFQATNGFINKAEVLLEK